jgi:hypothetical protein
MAAIGSFLAGVGVKRVWRIRTWKQAAITTTVVWSLVVAAITYQQQGVLVRVLLPPVAVLEPVPHA